MELNDISGQIIAAALKVHTVIGPGLLESVYQNCVYHELKKRGLQSEIEVPLPVIYERLASRIKISARPYRRKSDYRGVQMC